MARRARKARPRVRRVLRRTARVLAIGFAALVLLVLSLRLVNPPLNLYQASEWWRLGAIEKDWVRLRDLPDHVPLSAAAAEDANFCVHWGFDFAQIRSVLEGGGTRGASTITQQTAKNVFLWQDRSWVRKGLEAGFAVLIEALWGKRRIMEVYLNVAEFDEGVFGVEAAARRHFGVGAADLSRRQAALLMSVLPDPKNRSASRPGNFTARKARQVQAGAETLAADGRGGCISG